MQLKNVLVASLATAATAQSTSPNLTAALAGNSNLSNLTTFLSNPAFAGLVGQLGMLSNVTLLAPSNAAFAKLANSTLGMSLTNPNNTGLITAILQYHVLQGSYQSFPNLSFVPTALTNPMYSNVTGGQVVAAAAQPAPLHFTGGALMAANASGGPVNFTGGSIYAIDSFLVPPMSVSATALAAGLTSLVGAIQYVNLTGTVDSLKDVTIFAPANAAFAAIGNLNLTAQQIISALTYHVHQGPPVFYSTKLANTTISTLQGTNLTITVGSGGAVYVNQARVIIPNVLVAGGVVHVIDSVLNPGNATAQPNPSATGGSPAFSGAASGTNAPYTSVSNTASSTINTASAPGSSATRSAAGAPAPLRSGAIGAAALFGGAAVAMNW